MLQINRRKQVGVREQHFRLIDEQVTGAVQGSIRRRGDFFCDEAGHPPVELLTLGHSHSMKNLK